MIITKENKNILKKYFNISMLIIYLFYIILKLNIRKTNKIKDEIKLGIALCKLFEEAGHIFIKIGQLLTIRPDLLPLATINELINLRDTVKPFNTELTIPLIETIYKKKINDIFLSFTVKPIAAGSIAQIHDCTLKDNKKVILKLLRPNLKEDTKKIFTTLKIIIKIIYYFYNKKKYITILNILDKIEHILLKEINLENEITNTLKMYENFKYHKFIKIPKIYRKLSNASIIVLEKVNGIAIDDIENLKKNNLNLKKIATKFIEIFFTQVFEYNLFHADLHPGNVWVTKKKNNEFIFTLLDFGLVGNLSIENQKYMASNILAFTNKDYAQIAKLHIDSGSFAKKTTIRKLEKSISSIFEPILDKPLHLIPFKETIKKISTLAKDYKMRVKPEFFLFQKTLLTVEGLSRKIHPNLKILSIIKPILKRWGLKQLKLKNILCMLQPTLLTEKVTTNNKQHKKYYYKKIILFILHITTYILVLSSCILYIN